MKMLTTLFWTLAALAAGYLLIFLLLYLFQSYLIFHPVSDLPYTPEFMGLKYEDVTFESEDGVRLHGWYVPHENSRGTVLFQHGNAGNISGRLETIELLNRIGLNVFIYDYRGYGQSEGAPSETGAYKDAMAAWRYLTEERDIPADEIILMGRSLGGAITGWLANRVTPVAVILESTFISAPDLAADLYPIFPTRMMVKYDFPNKRYIRNIQVPILVAHSTEDDLIPYSHGRRLFELANEPKTFFTMQGDHGNGFLETGSAYIRAIDNFISGVLETKRIKNKQKEQ
ncbi:alpha/beta hydrolase [Halalkalibaculum sp. DA3122]|uniref:alpha/beta hydrolase n=1 Tax=Halalkalibaculum sp. DA3122 TaxID=3373607 RepID=UPI0037546EE0